MAFDEFGNQNRNLLIRIRALDLEDVVYNRAEDQPVR